MNPPYPPGPKSWLPGANVLAFRRDPLSFLQNAARTHGDIVHFKLGPQHVYFLAHPDSVKDVLVTHHDRFMKGRALQRSKRILGEGLLTSEGAFHRRQRRLAQPAFQKQRLAAYGASISDYTARTSARWHDGETLDIASEMMRLTLGIVGKTLFNADVESEAQEIGAALATLLTTFDKLFIPFSALLEKLPLPQTLRIKKAIARLDETIYRIVEARRRDKTDRGDLLSMLLNARDEEGDGAGMSDRQLRDEALTIFIAGHETTANALIWTWYLLSQHPAVATELHAELDRVLSDGRIPVAADLPQLRFTEMVLAESMRLYPPAWAVGRLAIEDYETGGYKIAKGSLIILSQYVTHRDARFFPNPELFDPHRFDPAAKEARHPYAYFPFGGGPRRCIGEGFAWMEGILLLAGLAKDWQLKLDPAQKVAPHPVMTLRVKYGMKMKLERRKSK